MMKVNVAADANGFTPDLALEFDRRRDEGRAAATANRGIDTPVLPAFGLGGFRRQDAGGQPEGWDT
ncbi:hypothetical protein DWG20_04125 [Crenobacter cavernae]|uniref:Uncharacterized protein n=1 Tax=Crenobacter cavernae TaxID=2290923 RepID=A0A345Y427_9NEIS|nr:hypothetical protein DWG20_04125 [Crenobacter cavernae]